MYYFLGIILKDNIFEGNFTPRYILCNKDVKSLKRSTFYMKECKRGSRNVPRKILFTSLIDAKYYVLYYSYYRTDIRITKKVKARVKKRRNKIKKKITVEGALFFFLCDKYGLRTGPCLFIKNIPDKKFFDARDGGMPVYNLLDNSLVNHLCLDNTYDFATLTFNKPKLLQRLYEVDLWKQKYKKKKEIKNAYNCREENKSFY